jgi:superfamily II DNA or RNA helicase
MNTQAIHQWQHYASEFDIDSIFDNPRLRERAVRLWRNRVCRLIALDEEQVSAEVRGSSGIYRVDLYRRSDELHYGCTCPSRYQPCKHVGALLYTLKEPPAREVGPHRDLQEGDTGLPPKEEIEDAPIAEADAFPGGAPFAEAAPSGAPGGREAPEASSYTPGELLRIDQADTAEGAPEQPGTSVFRDGPETEAGSLSEAAAFRPAFRLVVRWDYRRPVAEEELPEIEPVLVYLRKDGTDGRVESYNPRRKRRPGSRETEELLRQLLRREGRSAPALELATLWYLQTIRRGEERLAPPVELYLERPGRLEREKPAQLRRIRRITLRWKAEEYRFRRLRYRPELFLRDEAGYREQWKPREGCCSADATLLMIPVPATGSLWYLAQFDLPKGGSGNLQQLASLLRLRRSLAPEEVQGLAEECGSRFPGLVEVEEVPPKVRLITIVPTPVLHCSAKALPGFDTYCSSLELRFRYGNREREPHEGGELLPVGAGQARTLLAETDALDRFDADASWFIVPDEQLEQHFLEQLFASLRSCGCEDIYRPRPSSRSKGDPHRLLLDTAPYETLALAGEALLQRGFEIRLQGETAARAPARAAVRVVTSGEDWLQLEPGFDLEEDFLPIEEVPARGLARSGGRLYIFPPGSEGDALPEYLDRRRIHRRDLAALEEIADNVSNPEHPGLQDFFSLRRRLASFSALEETPAPDSFNGSLRPYQKSGLAWLWFLHRYELGGCLADDMGLGKTIQALALLAKAREAGEMRRALVVCPVSTLGNWRQEIERFTPHFSVQIHAGQGRARSPEALQEPDILLCGYATLQRDAELFRSIDFDYLILDEAQAIKNPRAKRRKAVASIPAAHRLALTGTPVENSTVELWSLMDILMPGILGSRRDFSRRYGREIEEGEGLRMETEDEPGGSAADEGPGGEPPSSGAEDALSRLRRIIRPLILRRSKTAVSPELPPREELLLYADAGQRQRELYESLRRRLADEVEQRISRGGRGEEGMKILEAMLRLRQAALLPALVDPDFARIPAAKLDLLYDRLIELRDEGNKALVFSQFTSVLDELRRRLDQAGLRLFRLDGSTPRKQRDSAIAAFQHTDEPAIFLISLKAGGVGINLTAADYVFLLDPWWNPAVESQAIDRAHRIGRVGSVLAYRLITRGTIEEKMLRLQAHKRRISESLIRGESGALRSLTDEDIRELFRR